MSPNQPERIPAVQVVATSWGKDAPVWVQRLAIEVDNTSQNKAAQKIGYSASVVSQVLKHIYTGSYKSVEERVLKVFGDRVDCPVLGDIDGGTCLTNQKAKYDGSNHAAVNLYVACRRCPHNLTCKGGSK